MMHPCPTSTDPCRSRHGAAFAHRAAALALLLALCIAAAPAQVVETLGRPGIQFSGMDIAAIGVDHLTVGWLESGPAGGLVLNHRLNGLWQTDRIFDMNPAGNPRDLRLLYDTLGRLHVVWTAEDGPDRVLRHALLPSPGETAAFSSTLQADAADAGPAICEFPDLTALDAGAMLVVWQETSGMQFRIRSARIEPDGLTLTDLGRISPASGSGLAPSILSARPARVAWYELAEIEGAMRVDEFNADLGRWQPSAMERRLTALGIERPTPLWLGEAGLAALPRDEQEAPTLRFLPADAPARADQVRVLELNTGPGDLTSPALDSATTGEIMLSYELFVGGAQRIVAALVGLDGTQGRPTNVSPPEHRFASNPVQVRLSSGLWGLAWIDHPRDGGSGAVYFSEIAP